MKKYLIIPVFIFISLFKIRAAWSMIYFEDAVFPELATTGRALAMGNAFLCKADDSVSAWYNPAGLGSVRHARFHMSNLHLETNRGWLNLTTGGTATDAAGNIGKGISLDGLRQLHLEKRNKISNTRVHIMPNFTARYISFGFLGSKRRLATMTEGDDAVFEYADRFDYGPYLSLNISLFGGVFKFGASGIYLNRHEAIGESDKDETIELNDENTNKGTALIVTGGGRLTVPIALLPTFSVTLHNATAQKFKGRAAGPPDPIKQTIDLGFSLTPQIGKQVRVHMEVNYKDFGGKYSDVSTYRKVLLGTEFDFGRVMFLRFGYGDGFGSAGLGIKTRMLEFDLTTYAVDTNSDGFRGREDRRFSLTLSTGF